MLLISSGILLKILNNYSIVKRTYTGIWSKHANQMHWFCVCAAIVIPYIKMPYSWFHKGQEKATKGIPEVRVTYLAIEYLKPSSVCSVLQWNDEYGISVYGMTMAAYEPNQYFLDAFGGLC